MHQHTTSRHFLLFEERKIGICEDDGFSWSVLLSSTQVVDYTGSPYLSPSEHSPEPCICACVFFLLLTAPLTVDSASLTAPLSLSKTNDIFAETINFEWLQKEDMNRSKLVV